MKFVATHHPDVVIDPTSVVSIHVERKWTNREGGENYEYSVVHVGLVNGLFHQLPDTITGIADARAYLGNSELVSGYDG